MRRWSTRRWRRRSAAQRQWVALPAAERGRVLNRVAAILRERKQELARLEVLDTGKPIQEAPEADIGSAADCFEFFAGLTQIVHGEHMPFGENAFAYTRREPLGVCAGIGAWNYPIQIASWKSAPALAAGNAMIFKPSELTPVTAVELAKIVEEAGAPAGLLNVVLGKGESARRLAEPSRHRKDLADRLGADRQARHGGGGRHAEARDDGARRQVGADRLRRRRSRRCGLRRHPRQFLHAGRNLLERHARLRARRASATPSSRSSSRARAKIRVGDPLDPQTQMGPLISAEHLEKVLAYVARGEAEGAKLPDRRAAAHRRRARARQFHVAGDLRRLPRRHDDRARGGVRAALERAAPSRTRRRWSRAPTTRRSGWPPA